MGIDPSHISWPGATRQSPQAGPRSMSQVRSESRALAQRTPTEVLTDNSNDRPDVATIAVLGYN
ncbi:hypothetical protein Tamer19_38830 [Cupriavidus sp. TA19]|uniref:hypothetical protein n=1 Tax=Cupriavidus sp. TA19 TaxID=701108 RepID=UPI000E2EA1D2|nr:hypothetical protein [Cupriavidus sp. TA19]BDB28424.1 hypothetical protein CTP10_R58350 [Cupriavidus sp. P-10]GLC94475.1 hypothetical protein Tamer19_38830 [Cupriavidus sp. TA19]